MSKREIKTSLAVRVNTLNHPVYHGCHNAVGHVLGHRRIRGTDYYRVVLGNGSDWLFEAHQLEKA